jgi:vacuolar-type H+-ATPase subunit H
MPPATDPIIPAIDDNATDALPRTEVDVQAELESLKESLTRGGPVVMNNRLWVNVDEYETHVDQIIQMLPREIRRARRVMREEQRILQDAKDEARRVLDEARAEANQLTTEAREEAETRTTTAREEAERILADANAEAERMVEASAIRQRALEQAEATIAQAEATAREVRDQSYRYAEQVIDNVVNSLRRLTASVEQDRTQLQQRAPDEQG